MKILAIDTSSDHGSAVIRIGDAVRAETRSDAALQHSEHLFGSLDGLFALAGIGLSDIDVFAAARGPGAFTGLRIGMAAVEGLAFATRKRAVGVSTLRALAWAAGTTDGRVAPVLDARRGEVFGAVFERRGGQLVEVTPPMVGRPSTWIESLSGGRMTFCGSGAGMCRDWIQRHDPWDIVDVGPYLAPSIAALASLDHAEPCEPLYVRATMAETRRSIER